MPPLPEMMILVLAPLCHGFRHRVWLHGPTLAPEGVPGPGACTVPALYSQWGWPRAS